MSNVFNMSPQHLPIVAVGAVVVYDNKILLVQRGKPPSLHHWAIPGGKVKPGETLQSAAEREIAEETGLIIKATTPIYTFDLIQHQGDSLEFHYVIVDLLAYYVSGEITPAGDAIDAGWFGNDEFCHLNIDANTLQFLNANPGLFAPQTS